MSKTTKQIEVFTTESILMAAAMQCCGFDCTILFDPAYIRKTQYVFAEDMDFKKARRLYAQHRLTLIASRYAEQIRKMQSEYAELFSERSVFEESLRK